MTSCFNAQFTRTRLGLATSASVQPSTSARSAPSTHIRSSSSVSSVFRPVAIPAIKSSTLSRPSTSASMSQKTESSVLRHVERLRKVRAAQATYKTSSAFAKPAVSIPVPNRPAEGPACRVQSTAPSAARRERAFDSHIERVTQARARRSPPPSARSSPATPRKVSPVLPLPQKSAAVDLARIDEQLAQLVVAPLAVKKAKPTPLVPALRSCLKTGAAASSKKVRFLNSRGWNIHRVRAYEPGITPPNTFIPLEEAVLTQPSLIRPCRNWGFLEESVRQMMGGSDQELRWPPVEHTEPALRWARRDQDPEYSRQVRERLSQPVI
ncbi:uncharacterized protein BP5553_05279 [Venustampulla echinocandica]|uniref:Uncharacterized protein n=1 Tax=Venustampulla echinocandica TaxID=2656787 RepID=A0A370TQN2_9HELO|nr:uncharacterized protein BP5553_05279 [Venustampulla echinocandica]RDL37846.1 hypothetical protein BP5553_05279 [Venustampulla echinocandica]